MNEKKMVIQTNRLCKHYLLDKEKIPVLKNVELSITRGEYVAIMGHSGAGKSTLLNIIGCLDTPSSGEFFFNGVNIAECTASQLADIRNKDIGFVFQNFNLLPKLSVAANVELPLIYGNVSTRDRKVRVAEVLTRFGLLERKRHLPSQISGGQKQRVAIARALVKKPSLILADEPTGNLDSATSQEILRVFDELHAEGNTILVITHENDVAMRAGRCIHLVDGAFVS